MDQIKIGRFIAACRREQKMTQASLAEKLGITDRAVSKWETGKSMPDSSIMLELCELLSINVNELLKGERIMAEEYEKTSEELILEFKKQDEEKTRFLLKLETVMGIIICVFYLGIALISGFYMKENPVLAVCVVAAGTVLFFVYGAFAIRIEQKAGYYKCRKCGHCFVPSYSQVFLAPHFGRSRWMTCPKCGKKSYHKKMVAADAPETDGK